MCVCGVSGWDVPACVCVWGGEWVGGTSVCVCVDSPNVLLSK